MRTSEERVTELHRRMEKLRRAKTRRKLKSVCAAMYAACLALVAGFATIVARSPAPVSTQVSGGAGASIFAEHAVPGYIVVAIVAFCLGVLLTLFCFRLKRHMEEEGKGDDRKL